MQRWVRLEAAAGIEPLLLMPRLLNRVPEEQTFVRLNEAGGARSQHRFALLGWTHGDERHFCVQAAEAADQIRTIVFDVLVDDQNVDPQASEDLRALREGLAGEQHGLRKRPPE